MSKDYYKILGIEKNASQEEIKKAFRKMAHKYHPDKKDGDEAKFKEANEAYQVLGNVEKRQKYDQFGSNFDQQGGFGGGMNWDDFMRQAKSGGFGGEGMNFDFGDIFGDMFGFGGNRRSRQNIGEDIQVDIQIELKDAIFGAKKYIELYKTSQCPNCSGSGAEVGSKMVNCSTCGGSGRVESMQRTFLGAIKTASTCPDCHGTGQKPEKVCSKCSGQGVSKQKEKIEINIPAGIEDGSTIRMTGLGNAAAHGGQSGDLYVRINILPDKDFARIGNNLLTKQKVSFIQAIFGDKIDVPTYDGEISLKIPAGTQPNTKFKVKGKGLPYLHSSSRGDLYVEIIVEIPTKLSRAQKKLLEDFEEK